MDTQHFIRISVKAIIVQDGRILLIRCRDGLGDWYCLPGGGQHYGEKMPDAVRRECREEIGVDVDVGPLRLVRDFIAVNHDSAGNDALEHQVELMFECAILSGTSPDIGPAPDATQVGVAWLEVASLSSHRILPSALTAVLPRLSSALPVVYLGE